MSDRNLDSNTAQEKATAPVRAGRRRPSPGSVVFLTGILLGPALLFRHLYGLWNPNGDYAYGWAVPLLAAFLFASRWVRKPALPGVAGSGGFLAVLCALLAIPALWLQEAAPERGICTWGYALAIVGSSLFLIILAGGASWFQWFGFPFAFTLTAVPWPHTAELLVTSSLMRFTAGATVEILCLLGIPSVQAGNLVHIENGVIDIGEACSGIRSLQAMVMVSLFLGELLHLRLAKRVLLVAIGLAVAILANIARTVELASIGFGQGMAAVDRSHDAAGFAILALSLLVTLLAGYLLRDSENPPEIPGAAAVTGAFPLQPCVAVLALLCIGEVSVEAWYRIREPEWRGWSWVVELPRAAKDFHAIVIPERSLQLLQCDKWQAAGWKEPDGSKWSLYWMRWDRGNAAGETAKVHRPDVCLNAEGAIMERDMGVYLSSVGGIQVPFHRYTFLLNGKILYVFFCLYEERPGAPAPVSNPGFEEAGMLQRAIEGERQIGQQSLELAISGYSSEQEAREAFTAHLGELMRTRSAIPGEKNLKY